MGVWTAEDSVLVLIDHQRGFEVIGSDTNADLPDGSRAPDNAALVTVARELIFTFAGRRSADS